MEAGTSDVTTCTCGVQPSDGVAATWQTPDEANGCGIVGLRLFNLIPPFDDCMFFFVFFFLKAWEMVQCRVYTEGKSFVLRRSDGVDTATEAAGDDLTPLRSSPAATLLPVSSSAAFDPAKSEKKNFFRDKICSTAT